MPNLRSSLRAMTGAAAALPALALATPLAAQNALAPLPAPVALETEVRTIPPVPVAPARTQTTRPLTWNEEVSVGPDGVETITRTRRIERSTPYPQPINPQHGSVSYPGGPVGHAPVVLERDAWIAECNRRTSGRSEREKGGIIGGLLGAVAGGIIGNRVADGERLAGTLIGAGTGGLAGLLLGNLIGGGKKDGRYDCEAALDGYLSYYGQPGASRIVHASPGHGQFPGYAPAYTGYYGYSAGCGCQQPLIAWIPIRTEVRQRVVVRERVTEEIIPGRRVIPPRPSPKMIRTAPRPATTKLIKQQ